MRHLKLTSNLSFVRKLFTETCALRELQRAQCRRPPWTLVYSIVQGKENRLVTWFMALHDNRFSSTIFGIACIEWRMDHNDRCTHEHSAAGDKGTHSHKHQNYMEWNIPNWMIRLRYFSSSCCAREQQSERCHFSNGLYIAQCTLYMYTFRTVSNP